MAATTRQWQQLAFVCEPVPFALSLSWSTLFLLTHFSRVKGRVWGQEIWKQGVHVPGDMFRLGELSSQKGT